MHSLLFSLKRAQHSTLRMSRSMLGQMGLTAARFDLLYALKARQTYGMPQASLRRILGVTRATVSRMLHSLEELGLVRRTQDDYDRRRKRVWLTEEGLARIDLAYEELVSSGWVQLALDSTLGTHSCPEGIRRGHCFKEMSELDWHLQALRRGFRDTGSLAYPDEETPSEHKPREHKRRTRSSATCASVSSRSQRL